MARHRHAVIWTRLSGEPQKMGDLVLSDTQASFTYTQAYRASGQPGFCLLGDPGIWGEDTVIYPVSERIPVFPRLLSLVPGNNPRNLQRRHYLDLLRQQTGREPPPGMDTEWQLLVLGGHGGIGHIDVFADDIAAERWYRMQPGDERALAIGVGNDRSELWRMLKRNVLDENLDLDPQLIEETLGPTPSVGGMIPKLLVSQAGGGHAAFFPPDTPGKTNVVLKVEPPEYAGLLDLEALCLDIHRQAGFEVPDYRRMDADDLHFLAIERFDVVDGRRLPMESLFSVIATGDYAFRETGDILLEEVGTVIERLGGVARLATDTGELLYRRILMALLTGNGDLHLDNIALLGGLGDCRLSPVYDPAPMRAWPRHNLVSAIPFDATRYADHSEFFLKLGHSFGLSASGVRDCAEVALVATRDYCEQVMSLARVPQRQRTQLCEIARRERTQLQKQLRGAGEASVRVAADSSN